MEQIAENEYEVLNYIATLRYKPQATSNTSLSFNDIILMKLVVEAKICIWSAIRGR